MNLPRLRVVWNVARWAAADSGHRTGRAVDVRLAFNGSEAFCGSAWVGCRRAGCWR